LPKTSIFPNRYTFNDHMLCNKIHIPVNHLKGSSSIQVWLVNILPEYNFCLWIFHLNIIFGCEYSTWIKFPFFWVQDFWPCSSDSWQEHIPFFKKIVIFATSSYKVLRVSHLLNMFNYLCHSPDLIIFCFEKKRIIFENSQRISISPKYIWRID
jgi:hypothetical protein